jgi:cytochrome c peroxidase
MHARRARQAHALSLLCWGSLVGCSNADPPADASTEDASVASVPVTPWPITPWPALPANDDPHLADKVALGRELFYDPILSVDGETACATCHSELWGLGDGLPLPIGAGAGSLTGPGREGSHVGRRNAQTLWNVAYRDALFWDGRSASLEAQASKPLENPLELDLDPSDATAAIAAVPEYVDAFEHAFVEDAPAVSFAHVTEALAAFERTLVTSHAAYDAYLNGDPEAMSAEMRAGMQVFADARCNACHVPPLFEGKAYVNRDVAGMAGVEDHGRAEVTDNAKDEGAYRVPTLRNARFTGPYFHDGSEPDLAHAITHEVALQEATGAGPFSAKEIDALVEFVSKALVDVSREPDRPDTVPSGLPVPRDGFRIPR